MDIKYRLYKYIGEKIKEARKDKGIVQDDLANLVGLTRTSITNIEAGGQKIQLHTLYEIAKELDCSVKYFLPELNELELSLDNLIDNQRVYKKDGYLQELNDENRTTLKDFLIRKIEEDINNEY